VVPSFKHDSGEAPCPAGGSTRQALNRAIRLVGLGYFPNGCPDLRPFVGANCSALRAELTQRRLRLPGHCKDERSRRSLDQGLKSLGRLFDQPCKPCDLRAAREARESWLRKATTPCPLEPVSWSDDPIRELTRVVSDILGPDWAAGPLLGDPLVDDQNGCLERSRKVGGSLSVRKGDLPFGKHSRYHMRVGIAKSKGKLRVVTMQSSLVKRMLRPYHEKLYDFLSCRKWLVRGDVTREHMDRLGPLEDGEYYVSGDYSSATDNIDPEVSYRVACEIASAPSLPPEVAECIRESYRPSNLKARLSSCALAEVYDVVKGQMMGNYFSFPILCLINRAAYTVSRRRSGKSTGPVLINGDDIAFRGTYVDYLVWKSTVGAYGMVVNEEKTGLSREFIELNSRSYYTPGSYFVKKPVFSFLRPSLTPGCLLGEILKCLKGFSHSVVMEAIVMMRFEIQQRGVVPSGIPRVLHKNLVTRKWYRQALLHKPVIVETGIPRAWPILSKDVRPADEVLELYDRRVAEGLWFGASLLRGRTIPQFTQVLEKVPLRAAGRVQLRLTRPRWVWRWPSHVWSFWVHFNLPVVRLHGQWELDHPDLATVVEVRSSATIPPPLVLLVDSVRPNGVNWV
jgi:hypothetical protein